MKNRFLNLLLISFTFLAFTSCENEIFDESNTLDEESTSLILPEITPNTPSLDLTPISKSDLPNTEYWEQDIKGKTMFWRSGTYDIDGEITLSTTVSEWNLRNTQYNKAFKVWNRSANYLFIEHNGLNLALPIYSNENFRTAFIWNGNGWISWRDLKYRRYTSTQLREIQSYSPNEVIPENWSRLSASVTGGNENLVGYLGLTTHLGTTGIHPSSPVPKNWVLYSSNSSQKLIRYLGVPETGDKTVILVNNLTLPSGWRYNGENTSNTYTIEYTDPN